MLFLVILFSCVEFYKLEGGNKIYRSEGDKSCVSNNICILNAIVMEIEFLFPLTICGSLQWQQKLNPTDNNFYQCTYSLTVYNKINKCFCKCFISIRLYTPQVHNLFVCSFYKRTPQGIHILLSTELHKYDALHLSKTKRYFLFNYKSPWMS